MLETFIHLCFTRMPNIMNHIKKNFFDNLLSYQFLSYCSTTLSYFLFIAFSNHQIIYASFTSITLLDDDDDDDGKSQLATRFLSFRIVYPKNSNLSAPLPPLKTTLSIKSIPEPTMYAIKSLQLQMTKTTTMTWAAN